MSASDDYGGLPVRRHTAASGQSTFQLKTGSVHEITLPSSLEYVEWEQPVASEGACVRLAVVTHWVGEGSPVEISVEDEYGKRRAKVRGAMHGDRFEAEVQVPEGAQALVAKVRLRELSLRGESTPLRVVPRVRIDKLAWERGEVREGEVVEMSARVRSRMELEGWPVAITVFRHGADGAHEVVTVLQAVVKNERVEASWQVGGLDRGEITSQGELDWVAEAYGEEALDYEWPSFVFRVEVLGVVAESGLLTLRDWVEVELRDEAGEPAAGQRCVLVLPNGERREATADSEGVMRFEDVPPGQGNGQVIIVPHKNEAGES